MKRAAISINMLVVIIIAVFAMSVFILFFTGTGAGLFSQFGQLEPETADDACQIACNNAKISHNCISWCSAIHGDGPDKCYQQIDCDFKDEKGAKCECPE